MIKLDVEKYCHECPSFEADVVHLAPNTYIWCKNRERCMALRKYLQKLLDAKKNTNESEKS